MRRSSDEKGLNHQMEYIISRNFRLPTNKREFADSFNYNLWTRKYWPYDQFQIGDIVYWYETPSRSLVWKTRTVKTERFPYQNKNQLHDRLVSNLGDFDYKNEPYFVNGPEQGYCLAYKSKPLDRLDLPKPENMRFPQLGWLSAEDKLAKLWLSQITGQRIHYKNFGEAPNDDSVELQRFARRVRKGQSKFRRKLLTLYGGKCAISGWAPEEVLDAAHISEHSKSGINHSANGILLRSDLHALMDANLLRINPANCTVVMESSLRKTHYWSYNGTKLRPREDGSRLKKDYLLERFGAANSFCRGTVK